MPFLISPAASAGTAFRRVAAVGTSALRNASNTREFVGTVSEKTGLDIRVISGEEEALLTLRGVMCSLRGAGSASGLSPEASMIIDIGGGSTEVIVDSRDGDPGSPVCRWGQCT